MRAAVELRITRDVTRKFYSSKVCRSRHTGRLRDPSPQLRNLKAFGFCRLFSASPATLEQELELLVARWTDRSRKGNEARSINEIGNALLNKDEELLDRPGAKPRGKR